MKKKLIILFILLIPIALSSVFFINKSNVYQNTISSKTSHWLILHRKSGEELLYYGTLGDVNNSRLIKTFQVKPGSASSPTPLPELLGRKYWLITRKESSDNLETAPYFLTLDIPSSEEWPYGPSPYLECSDPLTNKSKQCEWGFPGYFGLHGVNGVISKLSLDDPGSSGCIRHRDLDIIYLYTLLRPEKEEIRYYIKDI